MSEDLSLLKLIIYNLFRVLHWLLHQGLCNSGRSFPNGNPFPALPEGHDLSYLCEMEGEAQKFSTAIMQTEPGAGKGRNNNYHSPEREIGINPALKFRDQRMYLIPSLQHHLENKYWCWGIRQWFSSSGQRLLYQIMWCFPYIIPESEMSL